MDNTDNIKISKEDAIKLLLNTNQDLQKFQVFDKFGNYSFPTDIKMESPNNVCGTIVSIKMK